MSYVWEYSGQKGGALLVLLAIADFADEYGVCYPSYRKLAQRARIHPRQARRLVAVLIKSGEIVCTQKGGFSPEGKNLANVYQVIHKNRGGGDISPLPGVRAKCPGGRGAGAQGGRGAHVPPIIISNHHINKGADAPEPFGSGFKPPIAQTEAQLKEILKDLRTELAEILRPGGSAYPVEPHGERAERAAFLKGWIQETKDELARRPKAKAPK